MTFGRNPCEQVIGPVLEFMRRHGLGLDDLTDIGGEHLKSPVSIQREMAGREVLGADSAQRGQFCRIGHRSRVNAHSGTTKATPQGSCRASH
jgi:hypothetical protein